MFSRVAIVLASAALGAGASLGVGACGEDRGSVEVEGSGTATGGTSPTATTPTGTVPTAPSTTPTTETDSP